MISPNRARRLGACLVLLFCGIVNRWKQMGGWEDFGD